VPYACPQYQTRKIKLQRASHPIPDISGVKGASQMLELVSQAEENDLIICLLSGGGSSLMPQPCVGISLRDKRRVTDALLKSGATINEINTLRKHISGFKGGWLAKRAYPATVVNLILSDVVGDPLETIASGPTVPDSTTFQDAIEILKRYGLWAKAPTSVKKVLLNGEKGLIAETPKVGDKAFTKVHNVVVGNNSTASFAAYSSFQNAKLHILLLSSCIEGQAKDVGTMLASMAREVVTSGNPVAKPAGLVAGGETTVTVIGKGKGGRNQETFISREGKSQRPTARNNFALGGRCPMSSLQSIDHIQSLHGVSGRDQKGKNEVASHHGHKQTVGKLLEALEQVDCDVKLERVTSLGE
jgi:glycerate-2-kinase